MTNEEFDAEFNRRVRDAGEDYLNELGDHLYPRERAAVMDYIVGVLCDHATDALYDGIQSAVRQRIEDVEHNETDNIPPTH